MRQKTSDMNSFVEKQIKQFENEEYTKKAAKTNDDLVFNLPSSSPLPPFCRSFSTSSAVYISAYNNVTMDVLDVKTMLEQVRNSDMCKMCIN
jgi:hypothetical protein